MNLRENFKSAEYKDGKLLVTYEMSLEDIFTDAKMSWSEMEKWEELIRKKIADGILADQKEKIVKEVLEGVNWPEIVRSEVAQRVIRDIATKSEQRY